MAKIRKISSIENGIAEVIKILSEDEIEEAIGKGISTPTEPRNSFQPGPRMVMPCPPTDALPIGIQVGGCSMSGDGRTPCPFSGKTAEYPLTAPHFSTQHAPFLWYAVPMEQHEVCKSGHLKKRLVNPEAG